MPVIAKRSRIPKQRTKVMKNRNEFSTVRTAGTDPSGINLVIMFSISFFQERHRPASDLFAMAARYCGEEGDEGRLKTLFTLVVTEKSPNIHCDEWRPYAIFSKLLRSVDCLFT
jgi:hypothetical protein